MLFELIGNRVVLARYRVRYNLNVYGGKWDGEESGNSEWRTIPINAIAFSEEDKERIIEDINGHNGEITEIEEIDQSGNEWINGRKFGSYREAKLALETGEDYVLINELSKAENLYFGRYIKRDLLDAEFSGTGVTPVGIMPMSLEFGGEITAQTDGREALKSRIMELRNKLNGVVQDEENNT